MKINHNLHEILTKTHEKMRAALSADRAKVVDYASSLMELQNKLKAKDVVYMKVLPSDTSFAI